MALCLSSWTHSTTLTAAAADEAPFYPAGVLLHGTDQKSVILLWSRHVIQTSIFRGLKDALHTNLPPAKSNLIHFAAPTIANEITQIVVATNESIVLTSLGTVFRFRTAKTLQPVAHLTNVRCACTTSAGAFAMIRLSPDAMSIFVHIQPDTFEADAEASSKQFDISFEANALQSTWAQSTFVIKELRMPAGDPAQLIRVLQNRQAPPEADTTPGDHPIANTCLMVAIDNALLSLLHWDDNDSAAADDAFRVHLVHTFESPIVDMWLSDVGGVKEETALYVLLQSGTFQVLHCCRLVPIALRRCPLFIGDRVDCLLVLQNNVIAYSTGTHIVQSRVVYDAAYDSYVLDVVQETTIYGVVAMTCCLSERILLAVTENNMIYKVAVATQRRRLSADLLATTNMRLVDDGFLADAKCELSEIVRLNQRYEGVRSETLFHQSLSRLMAFVETYKCDRLSSALLPFTATVTANLMSSDSRTTVYDIDDIENISKYLTLSITIGPMKNATTFDLCPHNNWTLLVEEARPHQRSTTKTIRAFPITAQMLGQPLTLRIQTTSNDADGQLSIPQLRLAVTAQCAIGAENLLFKFDVHTTATDWSQLFAIGVVDRSPANIPSKKRQKLTNSPTPAISYAVHLPAALTFVDVCSWFGSDTNNGAVDADVFSVQLLGRCIYIGRCADVRRISLSASDARALFYVKQFVLLKLHALFGLRMRADCERKAIRVS